MTDGGIHSTGRGGAGNIGRDNLEYTDGEIVREGIYGSSKEPEYSSGRGGAGNIVNSPRVGTPVNGDRPASSNAGHAQHVPGESTQPQQSSGLANSGVGSEDMIPETAMRTPGQGYENFHTGRGGGGNVYREKYGGHSGPQSDSHMKSHHGQSGAGDEQTAGQNHEGFVGKVEDKVKQLLHREK